MRLVCPLCGARDVREFSYKGDALLVVRPAADAGAEAFHEYVHIRENPAGRHAELWFHGQGCGAWLRVERDTVTHEVFSVALAREGRE
ncbi:MAG: sarcosine oxidase subunit delta [Pseudomonadota bacterium]